MAKVELNMAKVKVEENMAEVKVEQNNCWEAMLNGPTGNEELDTIMSILDFPMESLEGNSSNGNWDSTKSSYLLPVPSDVPMNVGSSVLPPPVNATSELQELTSYLHNDSSLSFVLRRKKPTEAQQPKGLFQKQSPVSVLNCSNSWKTPLGKSCKKARSKRARRSDLSMWISTVLPTAPAGKSCSSRKNRESKGKLPQLSTKNPLQDIAKKCVHCQVTKTPQWREGPTGPKTLCNACGVRFRSGGLLPEYRPAASPTFVPSVHSNSHRKVHEMRNKGVKQQVVKVERPSVSVGMEFVSGYLLDDPI